MSSLRFSFGQNWSRYIKLVDEERIAQATTSLAEMLQARDLSGMNFLDIGSGSGLFSLAARRLGASVHSFDLDDNSVACTRELRARFGLEDERWTVGQGSVLDERYMEALGLFDVVYSWGVLHHTGSMWKAIEIASRRVKEGGLLYIALYNDQGVKSTVWGALKKTYNRLPNGLRQAFSGSVFALVHLATLLKYTVQLKPWIPIRSWTGHSRRRGMNLFVDWTDWIGGYPFEVASPERVQEFLKGLGFVSCALKRTTSLGCNEFLFRKAASAPAGPR